MNSTLALLAGIALVVPLALPTAGLAQEADGSAAAAEEISLFDRVHLLGASVTVGFNLEAELEAPAGLELFVESALRAPHGEVANFGDTMFFMDPRGVGKRQAEQAQAGEPTLVLALDYLFWYAYGDMAESQRPRLFEEGLERLDEFACPMVVADLPDMRPAVKGSSPLMGGRPLITPSQVPAPETLAALNARLSEWAAERPRVVVLPLADFVARLRKGEELRAAEQTVPAGAGPALLQSDLLHTTVEGTAIFTLLALEALADARADFDAEDFAGTTDLVVAGVFDRTEETREKRRERERRREERRKAREKEAGGGGGVLAPRFAAAR